jgi:hypothetical protein
MNLLVIAFGNFIGKDILFMTSQKEQILKSLNTKIKSCDEDQIYLIVLIFRR